MDNKDIRSDIRIFYVLLYTTEGKKLLSLCALRLSLSHHYIAFSEMSVAYKCEYVLQRLRRMTMLSNAKKIAWCGFIFHITEEQYYQLAESETIWECSSCQDCDLPALNSVNADVFHFDFQQNLPTPKLSVGKQFYWRLLWTYLFGIYSASAKITTAFMWHEMLWRRGCNDVISCLSRFIFHTALGCTGAQWSIWWADNCPGQNKNNYIM